MIYQWKKGSHHKVEPEVAAEVMNGLAEKGTLNAETLVDVSKDENSPMHPEFDWDDTTAAHNWRLHQARNVINALVMIDDAEPEKEPVRVFLKIESVNQNQYESTQVLVRTQTGRDAMIEQAERELKAFRAKYEAILTWTNAISNIDSAIEQIKKKMSQ